MPNPTERLPCPSCGRSCAARAPRCSGCGAVLGGGAAPPTSTPAAEASGDGWVAVLRALAGIGFLVAAIWLAWERGWLGAQNPKAVATAAPAREVPPPVSATPPPRSVVPDVRPAVAAEVLPADARPLPNIRTHAGWLADASGYRAAVAEQSASDSPMVVYFWADWCGYCKQFDATVLPDGNVGSLLATAVKVKIEPERGDAESRLSKQFGSEGYPEIFLVTAPGATPIQLSPGVARDEDPKPSDFADSYRERLDYAWGQAALESLNAGRLDDAIARSDRLAALDPKYGDGYAYEIRADAFRRKGDLAASRRDSHLGCALGCKNCCAHLALPAVR